MSSHQKAPFLYQPCVRITALGDAFYDAVKPAKFPKAIVRHRNNDAAKTIGLAGLTDDDWVAHFGRFEPLPDNLNPPLALRYHGHQFRHYNRDLGDGRGFLFAQMRGDDGRLLDLGTKGSGQTPWSRAGDGRLTLLGGVRETLATAYLQALGVNTSKTLSLIETGEALERGDEPSPTRSAVMVRLSHSHIRFGTFQRLAFESNAEGMEALVAYCFEHYYAGVEEKTAAGLLDAVIRNSAHTVASWMVAGFVHGVMNTDNMNITGESFDYGPFRFSPTLQSSRTAAYFDHQGLYAFGRQPETMYWNLGQLGSCLTLISDDKPLLDVLENFQMHYRAALRSAFFTRLGLRPSANETADIEFVNMTFQYLENSQSDLAQFYFDYCGGAGMPTSGAPSQKWFEMYAHYDAVAKRPQTERPVTIIHEEIEMLWKPIAEHDDWGVFTRKLHDIKYAL